MSIRFSGVPAAIAAVFLAGVCEAGMARSGRPVMGTILSVTVIAETDAVAKKVADDAIEEARRWDDALTIWRPEGELARFNARAGSGDVAIGPRLESALAAMLDFARRTDGAFDPAVGSIRGDGAGRPVVPIAGVLRVSGGRASLANGSALDPGAIGKGLAIDVIVDLVRKGGATAAFVDFGGSSQTGIGVPPGDERGWPVLVAGRAEGSVHGVVRLRDASLSTSRAGAADTTPVLDPRTGSPVAANRLATVVAPTAAAADAWSTALVVLGPGGLPRAQADTVNALVEDERGIVRTGGFVTETAE